VLRLRDLPSDDLTHDGFSLGAAALFLAAGVLRTARWRVTTDAHSAYVAGSLFVLALLALPVGHLLGHREHGHLESSAALGAHTLATGLALALALRALTVYDDDTDRTWRGTLVAGTAAAVTALAAMAVLFSVAPTEMTGGVLAHQTLEVLLAAAWIVLGLAASSRDATQPWAGRVAPLYGCLGVVALLGSLEHVQPGAWAMPAAALLCSVGMVTAHSACVDLVEAVRLAESVRHRTDMLVAGADDGLGGGAQHRAAPVEVEASDVVSAVAERRRSSGQLVRVRAGVGAVKVRPAELAAAVDRLLVNAQTHAPGSPVTLQVLAIASRVEISVSDRGPGLSADAAGRVFAAGERDSGLGLHVARSLVSANGGELELRNRIGGATFVISLPAADATDAVPASAPEVPVVAAERRRRRSVDVSSHAV
jgi:signal transduction histidine kinase